MIPILFPKDAVTFTSNGLGRLFPISCKVEEERNGKYEAEIEISDDQKHYTDVGLEKILLLKVSDGSLQPFRIYKIEKSLNDNIVINACHISYDLSMIPVAPFNANSTAEALAKVKQYSLVPNIFTFDTDIISDAPYTMRTPLSARAYLGGTDGSILDKYHGEYEFNGFNVYLHSARGSNNGVVIRYGKNLTDLDNEDTCEDTIDGLLPYWTDGEFSVMGGILRVNTGNKIIVEDVSDAITVDEGEQPTVAQVESAGRSRLRDKITGYEQTIKVSWYEDKSISDVQLCDTVNVIYEPYGVDVDMKVTKTVWDVLEERYEEIELGEYKSFVKTLSQMSTDISNLQYNDGQMLIRLERTEDGIEAEVTRATSEEERLSGQIDIKAGEVVQQVSATVKTWDTSSYNISVYGIGSPYTQDVAADEHYQEYYLDNASGELWYSNGSIWYHVAYLTSVLSEVRGELALKISNNDDGTIISLINGSANIINFNATNMFTVNAPNFTVDHQGNISAKNADLKGTTNFLDANGNTLGYIGSSVLGGGGYGIGLRNASDNTGIAFANYGDGYLWFKSNNNTMVLAGSNLRPNSDGGLDLGSSSYHWDWIACNHISCVNPPWSTSDKRLKDVKGAIKKAVDFYMSLNPIEYTFKDGVAYEDSEKMHYGLIAQDVLNSYEKCYNTDKQGIVKREEVLEDSTKKLLGEDYKYSINYDELHAFHIKMIQSLVEEVQALKDENNRLSVKIDEIERRLK